MIKIISKIFSTKEDVHETHITIEKEPSPQELFDEAVKEVIRKKQYVSIREQLVDMCFTEKQVKQTKTAVKEYGLFIESNQLKEVLSKYPDCLVDTSGYCNYRLGKSFDLERFINAVLDGRTE